jgi:hypothetical protein
MALADATFFTSNLHSVSTPFFSSCIFNLNCLSQVKNKQQ